jgi:hypothetical protein
MKKAHLFTTSLLILLIPLTGIAETVYDQPYLGEFPQGWFKDRYSVSAWQLQAASDLASVVRRSDLVVLGESERVAVAPESDDHITIYDTDVKVLKIYKGSLRAAKLRLRFPASATGIEDSAKHVFFLKTTATGFEVLKSSYIFSRGIGYDNHMRLFGAIDSGEDVGIDVINYLATSALPEALDQHLENEYFNGSTYAAVHMAFATRPKYGSNVLKLAVSDAERKRFDIGLFGLAAYGLAVENKQENWRIMLESIPTSPSYGRLPESIVFDLAANFGGPDAAEIIQGVVSSKPELAVSAAFALSKIGGRRSRAVIKSWLKDSVLSNREEKISNGWNVQRRAFSSLFAEALARSSGQK